jgi:hypothetical protein
MTFFISLASAEVIITEQPNEIYNLGDIIEIPIKITTITEINKPFTINIICNGIETLSYFENIFLQSGEEKKITPLIPLTKKALGRSTGTCKIKAVLGEEIYLTNEFAISDSIKIELKNKQIEVNPGGEIIVEIEAIKENKEIVEGFVEVKIVLANESSGDFETIDTIKKGYGYITIPIPLTTKAGQYLINIYVSEKNFENEITNNGFLNYNIKVLQVPTSLEIILENENVEPDTNALIKTILHDQTGEKINSFSLITIKNEKEEIIEKIEKSTEEFLEIPINYKQPPAKWSILAESNNLTSTSSFQIIEKEKVDILIINKTLIITNIGNVFYNNTISVKIDNASLDMKINLDIDEFKKYLISAPDGEYSVEVFTEEGNEQIVGGVLLTGKKISIREASEGLANIARYPISWVFIIIILGLIVFIIFKKGYKKSFFGNINLHFKNKKLKQKILLKKSSLINPKNKAELSLSIKGKKQEVSLVCLKIKNLNEIQKEKNSSSNETLKKIIDFAEEKKATIYENQENIFFILTPLYTKTFGNEKISLEIAQKIKENLKAHNKLFKQNIETGISLNKGIIVEKQDKNILKFMSMGTLIATAKKIANISQGEILLGEKIKDKLNENIKTKENKKDKIKYYSITKIKNPEEHKKFIRNFLDRLEK